MEEELSRLAGLVGHESFSVHPAELLGRARYMDLMKRSEKPNGIRQYTREYDPLVGLPSNTLENFVENWRVVPQTRIYPPSAQDPRVNDPRTFRFQQNRSGLASNPFAEPIVVQTCSRVNMAPERLPCEHREGQWEYHPPTNMLKGPDVVRKFVEEGKRARPVSEDYLFWN